MFLRSGFYDKLNYRFTRAKNNNYSDIYDGSVYKQLFENQGILSSRNNLSFMWYADGVQVFRSSKFSIWNFVLVILELPLVERYKPENILTAGLWFGDHKPNPNVFLRPIKNSLRQLFKGHEIFVKDLNESKIVRGLIISGTCDLPAKAVFLNMNQYNGGFGCQVCKQDGITINKTRIYEYQRKIKLRTDKDYYNDVANAVRLREPVFGVKGPTIMSKICYNLITSTSVDVMHCVYEGIVKKLLELWFDVKYASEKFSIYKFVNVIDELLLSIKPPSYVSR